MVTLQWLQQMVVAIEQTLCKVEKRVFRGRAETVYVKIMRHNEIHDVVDQQRWNTKDDFSPTFQYMYLLYTTIRKFLTFAYYLSVLCVFNSHVGLHAYITYSLGVYGAYWVTLICECCVYSCSVLCVSYSLKYRCFYQEKCQVIEIANNNCRISCVWLCDYIVHRVDVVSGCISCTRIWSA